MKSEDVKDKFSDLFLTENEEKRYQLEKLAKSFIKDTRHEARKAAHNISREWTADANKLKEQIAALTKERDEWRNKYIKDHNDREIYWANEMMKKDAEISRLKHDLKLANELLQEQYKKVEELEKEIDIYKNNPVVKTLLASELAAVTERVEKLPVFQQEVLKDNGKTENYVDNVYIHIIDVIPREKVLAILRGAKEGKV
jgi:hypothetical protein